MRCRRVLPDVRRGNDFILFDTAAEECRRKLEGLARELCARSTSVGADGVVLLERSQRADVASVSSTRRRRHLLR